MISTCNTLMTVASFLVVVCMNMLSLFVDASRVPCFFIFGDSLVDNGNNNQLETRAKANYPPYGIDFPGGPTGRFTNGRNLADLLAELLGFEIYIPPFAITQYDFILEGVNYGSGSSGIRDESGKHLGDRISISRQLQNHNITISKIVELYGNNETLAKQHLSQCLYLFVTGSNDYVNNYYMPEIYPTRKIYTPPKYAKALIEQYADHLMHGARKIAVAGIAPIGCIPAEVSKEINEPVQSNGTVKGFDICKEYMNDAVKLFNLRLQYLVKYLKMTLKDAEFAYISALTVVEMQGAPCCTVNDIGHCTEGITPCPLRGLHAFFDNFHPTELINRALAAAAYTEMRDLY